MGCGDCFSLSPWKEISSLAFRQWLWASFMHKALENQQHYLPCVRSLAPRGPGPYLTDFISTLSDPKGYFHPKQILCQANDTCQWKKKLILQPSVPLISEGGNRWSICECSGEKFIKKEKYGSSVKINAVERKNGLKGLCRYSTKREREMTIEFQWNTNIMRKWNHFVHAV